MNEATKIIKDFSSPCPCGLDHKTAVRDIRIGSGIVENVGEILRENGFPQKLLLVADTETLKAAHGIEKSLSGFCVKKKIYDSIRVAEIKHVCELEEMIAEGGYAILSVGTGSVNDPCRLAAARMNAPLCIFGTAPSMDGFASYSSPLVDNGFKSSYGAKSPEVIIADTQILASSPVALKSAGFGDMMAKYVGLIDWKVSHILTDEIYCERVASLTKTATDRIFALADKVRARDEDAAGRIFEALLMTGLGMSFIKNSRPASGCEHIIAHLIECKELQIGKIPNFHGEDIGVCTLYALDRYAKLADMPKISARREKVDWQDVYDFYGNMAEQVRRINSPKTIADLVEPSCLEEKWGSIRKAIKDMPDKSCVESAMKKAGCKITVSDIGKDESLFLDCVKYSPYMRNRLTLLRISGMIS